MQVYNVRKLHFQANLCEVFAEDKQQRYCGDLKLYARGCVWCGAFVYCLQVPLFPEPGAMSLMRQYRNRFF